MGARPIAIGAMVLVALIVGALVLPHRGDQKGAPLLYKASWTPPQGGRLEPGARAFRRDRRTFDIAVEDGTCFPSEPASRTDPRRRLRQVRVRERQDRVIITVVMRPERRLPAGEGCAGVGRAFLHRVRLAHPVRRRAVVSDDVYDAPDTPIVYRALDRTVQGRLEREYLRPAARSECSGTPSDVLAMKYDTKSSDGRTVAQAAANAAPKAARETVYRACLAGLRGRD